MKGGHGWAGMVLAPPGTEEGRGSEEDNCFLFFLCLFACDFEYSSVDRHGAWIAVRVDILT